MLSCTALERLRGYTRSLLYFIDGPDPRVRCTQYFKNITSYNFIIIIIIVQWCDVCTWWCTGSNPKKARWIYLLLLFFFTIKPIKTYTSVYATFWQNTRSSIAFIIYVQYYIYRDTIYYYLYVCVCVTSLRP